jgi:MFS family permease
MWVVIFGRAVQGIGGDGVWSKSVLGPSHIHLSDGLGLVFKAMATLILCDNVPPRRRPLYQSGIVAIYAIGATSGASLGGIIAEHLGWRWNFFLAVPICAITILLAYIYVVDPPPVPDLDCPLSPYERFGTIDVRGALLLVAGLCPLMAAVSIGGSERPWTDPLVLCFLVSGLVLLGSFLYVESRAKLPILPLKLLRGRSAVSNILTNFSATFAYFVVSVLLSFSLSFQTELTEKGPVFVHGSSLFSSGQARVRWQSWHSTHRPQCGRPFGLDARGFHHDALGPSRLARASWLLPAPDRSHPPGHLWRRRCRHSSLGLYHLSCPCCHRNGHLLSQCPLQYAHRL